MVDKRKGSQVTSIQKTPETLLGGWEQNFRAAFARDGGAQFEALIKRFGLEVDTQGMLEGTIDFVNASAALLRLDGRRIEDFLGDQQYGGQTSNATYALTFDVGSQGAARLLVEQGLKFVDLADLYEYPWHRLELVGYSEIWVSRTDGNALDPSEVEELVRDVTDDIRFDLDEEEVSLFFDPDSYAGALAISICDTPETVINPSDLGSEISWSSSLR
jgi:hypothetical protein